MMTLLYIVLYFAVGFAVAKIKKGYDQEYNSEFLNTDRHYALLGMLWLPCAFLWVVGFSLAFVYGLYKSKL